MCEERERERESEVVNKGRLCMYLGFGMMRRENGVVLEKAAELARLGFGWVGFPCM